MRSYRSLNETARGVDWMLPAASIARACRTWVPRVSRLVVTRNVEAVPATLRARSVVGRHDAQSVRRPLRRHERVRTVLSVTAIVFTPVPVSVAEIVNVQIRRRVHDRRTRLTRGSVSSSTRGCGTGTNTGSPGTGTGMGTGTSTSVGWTTGASSTRTGALRARP